MGMKLEIIAIFTGYVATRQVWEAEFAAISRTENLPNKAELASDYLAAIEIVREDLGKRTDDVMRAAIAQAEIAESMETILGDGTRQAVLTRKLKALAGIISSLWVLIARKPWGEALEIGTRILEAELGGWNDELTDLIEKTTY